MIWFTIDVEEVTDMNFNVLWRENPTLNYEVYIQKFIKLAKNHNATAFILGSFAEKHPEIVKIIAQNGIEIACHGYEHNLVYKEDFIAWCEGVKKAKEILEQISGMKIQGYRSPSWSLPFEKKYYTQLAKIGFTYSSSYFPMKNYMYGNSINKQSPFTIFTEYGSITERPVPKGLIPFSGGFYLRVLPLWLLKYFFKKTIDPVLYVHPYELMDTNLLFYFKKYTSVNIDYILAFFTLGKTETKIKSILHDT